MPYTPQIVPPHVDTTDQLRSWLEEELRRLGTAYATDELSLDDYKVLVAGQVTAIESRLDNIEDLLDQSGDFLQFSGGPTSLTTATALSVASGSIPAGVWDLNAGVFFGTVGATSSTEYQVTIGTVANTVNLNLPDSYFERRTATLDWTQSVAIGPVRVTLVTPTTYYVTTRGVFSSATLSASALLEARRVIS